jgi:Protein of unknown function (DUF4058)
MLPLRQRLPAIRVPLPRSDPDVALDLQGLTDQCYERGRYGSVLDYAQPPKLDAQKWLELNRAAFGGIENGLHQRLNASHNDDRCRIRHPCAMFVAGLFRRISNSLFMERRSHQPHPEHQTTTDFQAAMGEDHCRAAMRLLFAKRPSLKPP